MHRRHFLQYSITAFAGAAWSWPLVSRAASVPKHILILGGTHFLGPAIVEAAVAQGHTVTLFNRGVSDPFLFPHLELLRGFRSADPKDQDLSSLAQRHFDVAVDVWPNDPTIVSSAAEFLKDKAGHYMYVSSIGAYDTQALEQAGLDESAPLEAWSSSAGSYGRGKAESERRLGKLWGQQITVVRPGPIKGTRDSTPDLFTWLMRVQSGGTHIGPGTGNDPVEWVDVKDVARFLMLAIDRSLYGPFNLAGTPSSFRQFLDACNKALRSDTQFEWIPQLFLREHGLETDFTLKTFAGNFPHWRPPGSHPGIYQISSAKAYRAGWQTRPFEETVLDTLSSYRSMQETLDWSDYLPAEKEQAVLHAWLDHKRRGNS